MSRGKTRKVVRKGGKGGNAQAPQVRAQSGSKPRQPPKSTGGRCTELQANDRTQQALDWQMEGWSSEEIVQAMADKYGISERQSREYIKKAKEKHKELLETRARITLEEHLLMRRYVYKDSIGAGDRRVALAALKDWARLEGHYASDRALLARAGLDDALKDSLANADSAAADILRQAYRGDTSDD